MDYQITNYHWVIESEDGNFADFNWQDNFDSATEAFKEGLKNLKHFQKGKFFLNIYTFDNSRDKGKIVYLPEFKAVIDNGVINKKVA